MKFLMSMVADSCFLKEDESAESLKSFLKAGTKAYAPVNELFNRE